MKSYSLRPFLIPTILGAITAFALLAALLSDGILETISVVLMLAVILLVIVHLLRRQPRN